MIVATFRDDERPDLPEQLPQCTVIKLNRLSSPEIEQLSLAMLGQTGKKLAVLDLLEQETEGNAFFIVEVVEALAQTYGRLDAIGVRTLPKEVITGGIEAIIRRRLGRMPLDLQDILKVVAVAGRYLDFDVLAYILDYPDFDLLLPDAMDFDTFLQLGTEAAVFEVHDEQWRFSHDKIRETILKGLTPEESPILHQQTALALEAVYADTLAPYAEVLIDHWNQTQSPENQLPYILTATANLRMTARFQQALTLLERGATFAENQGDEDMLMALYRRFGRIYIEMDDYERAQSYYEKSLVIAEANDDLLARTLSTEGVAEILWRRGNLDEAEDIFKQNLQAFQALQAQAELGESLNYLGALYQERGDFDTAIDYFKQALPILQAQNDQNAVANVLNNLGNMAAREGDFLTGIAYLKQVIEIMVMLGNRKGIAMAHTNLASLYFKVGQFEESAENYDKAFDILLGIGDKTQVGILTYNLGYEAMLRGELEQADAYYQRGLEAARATQHAMLLVYNLYGVGLVAFHQQAVDKGTLALREGFEMGIEMNSVMVLLLMLSVAIYWQSSFGDAEQAAAWAELIMNHEAAEHELREEVEVYLQDVRETLGEEKFEAAFESGKSLDLDAVVQDVLELLTSS